jgi:Sigma-70, region 4
LTRAPHDAADDRVLSDGIPAGLRNDDPRLRDVLPPALLPTALRRVVDLTELEEELPDGVRAEVGRVAALISSMTLEAALVDLLRAADAEFHSVGRRRRCEERWLEAMALRIGLVGKPPMTLEEVGRRLGVTRERVRQVMAKHMSLPNCRRPYLPQIDRVLELVHDLVPCSAEEVGAILQRQGITASQPSFDSLRAAAVFTGRSMDLVVSDGLVVRDRREAQAILVAARKLTTRHGVFRAEQLADEVAIEGWKLTDEDAERYLLSAPDVRHLTADYFVHTRAGRNRLVSALRTTLCLRQPMPLAELTAATRRLYEWRNFGGGSSGREVVPPGAHALRAFCLQHDDFVVEETGDTCLISSRCPLDWREILSAESRIMVTVLREAPHQVLDRQTFLARCEARGVRSNTAAVHLTYHPAFVRLGRNLWTLLGHEVPPELIERLQGPRRPHPRE